MYVLGWGSQRQFPHYQALTNRLLLPGSSEGTMSSSVEGGRIQLQSYFQVSLASPFLQCPNEEEGEELVLSTLLFAERCVGSLSHHPFSPHPPPQSVKQRLQTWVRGSHLSSRSELEGSTQRAGPSAPGWFIHPPPRPSVYLRACFSLFSLP